jgi:hypothetical protein
MILLSSHPISYRCCLDKRNLALFGAWPLPANHSRVTVRELRVSHVKSDFKSLKIISVRASVDIVDNLVKIVKNSNNSNRSNHNNRQH